ncbi:hypothetical protein JCM11251_003160 [Rhodosporidiobolus azoricus]
MGYKRPLLLTTAALAAFTAFFVQPRLALMGVGREVVPLNNDKCVAVPGLEACEDAWVDSASGLAYLACSTPASRVAWTPAMLHLNASALPLGKSQDKLVLLDLRTRNYQDVKLSGLPDEAQGVWVHGMDVYRSPSEPEKLSLFLISHRPPSKRSSAPLVGADSVVEIFETRLGEKEARWVKTVRHEKVKTQNSIAAVGERAFYVTNDHRDKVHWTRKWEKFYPSIALSSIVYCDASAKAPDCTVAADGLVYPNGLTYSPSSDLVYQACTLGGYVNIFRRSSSSASSSPHALSLLRTVSVARPLDNLHLDPSTGSVYATALAKSVDFVAAAKDGGAGGGRAAVEVWRIGPKGEEKAELVFADLGDKVSASTTAAPFRLNGGGLQLLLTGLFSNEVVLCQIE